MLNQCILVGKVAKIECNDKDATITLNIPNYQNDEEVDAIDVVLSNNLKSTALEYLKENATVGVKARIKSVTKTIAKTDIKLHLVVAEKITFINSKNDGM